MADINLDNKVLYWGALIGLVAAVIGLITAVILLYSALQQANESADQSNRDLHLIRQWAKAEQDKIERERLAIEQARICQSHTQILTDIDIEFNGLLRDHGRLMSAMQSCKAAESQDDRGKCSTVVCLAALWWTSGQSNCIDVVTRADEIKKRAQFTITKAAQDQCKMHRSSALSYYE